MLREWRKRRNLSQLALALLAGSSARHLSFVETGRAKPSREMVLCLAETLDVPVRQRNSLMLAAGYAPVFEERAMNESEMDRVNDAITRLLNGHEPYPALVFDAVSDIVIANRAALGLLDGVATELLEPPMNIMRLSLHPDGLPNRIINFAEWQQHLLNRLRRQALYTNDDRLLALYDEVRSYQYEPGLLKDRAKRDNLLEQLVVPLRLHVAGTELNLFSAVTTFASPIEINLAELSIETFYPADSHTASALQGDRRPEIPVDATVGERLSQLVR